MTRDPGAPAPPALTPAGATRLNSLLAATNRLDPESMDGPADVRWLAQVLALPQHPLVSDPGVRCGPFVLRTKLGTGAQGVVLLADDTRADRRVALKLLLPTSLLDREARARFVREGRAAERLEHPGVARFVDAGECGGVPFLATEYVPGPTLAEWLSARPERTSPGAAADLVARIADAVGHAHERGVLHCDLTPTNILLRPLGPGGSAPPGSLACAPVVTDFGLSQLAAAPPDDSLSRSVWVAGTARYMAPEQAHGARRSLSARTDVWALGVILYQLLTGRTPFDGASPADVLARVLAHPPAPTRAGGAALPRDVEAVCLKCLEKAPGDRYAGAADLAADLRRFLAGRPTRARPVGPLSAAVRWGRRRPTSAVAVLLAALAWAAIPALVVWYSDRLDTQEGSLKLAAAEAAVARERAREQGFYAALERVRQRRGEPRPGWADENLLQLRGLAALAPDRSLLAELRSEAAAALAAPDLRRVRDLAAGFEAYCPAFSPDGTTVALCGWEWDERQQGRVALVNAATGRTCRELVFPISPDWSARADRPDGCRSVCFSPDGRWLVAGTRGGQLVRWDLTERAPQPVVWGGHSADNRDPRDAWVTALAFTADGGTLFSSSLTSTRAWRVHPEWRPQGGPWPFLVPRNATALDEPFPVVDVQNAGARLRRFDPKGGLQGDGPPSAEIAAGTRDGRLAAAEMSPLGTLGVVACDTPECLWPLLAREQVARRSLGLSNMVFSPDASLLVTTEEGNQRLKIWDVASGMLAADRPTTGGSGRLAFSPDGRHVAVAENATVVLYALTGQVLETLAVDARCVHQVAVRADGRELVTATRAEPGRHLDLNVWRTPLGQPPARAHFRRTRFTPADPHADFAPDGKTFAFATNWLGAGPQNGDVRLELSNGSEINCNNLAAVRFGPDGRMWLAENHRVCVRAGPDRVEQVLANDADSQSAGRVFLAVAPGRTTAAVGRRDGHVFLLAPGRPPGSVPVLSSPVQALAMSPDEQRIFVGGGRGELAVLGAGGHGITVRAGAHRDAVTAIAVGPGGWLVTGSADRTVRIWDEGLEPVLTLRGSGPVQQAFLSADGQLLTVLANGERGVRRWRLDLLAQALRELGLDPGPLSEVR